MEPWRVRPLVADSHLLDNEQDPDPRYSEKSDPDPHSVETLDTHKSDANPQHCFFLLTV
jgi:hypothetical protein